MLGAMLIAIVVTLIPLLRRDGDPEDGPYDAR
jgi:UDP-GlcNAc:undecaprenyl-phosphate GlcNAc-1-phosphate transferase